MPRKKQKLVPKKFLAFVLKQERRSSLLLLIAAAAALTLANSSWSASYFGLLETRFEFWQLNMDLKHWINEGLMALFFLVVMLEVKREFIDGELRNWKKSSFVVFAAIGGMLAPALIFAAINPYPPSNLGWAIPMSTDTAIALGVIGLLGRGVPKNLRVFLLALAIIDDIVCITIIGLFYSQPTNMFALLMAAVCSLLLLALRSKRFHLASFAVLGVVIWYCLVLSGVSGTLAGVIVGLAAPLVTSRSNAAHLQESEIAEDLLLPITTYFVVPVFVFVNAGLSLSNLSLSQNEWMIFTGVGLGLVLGKPIGIFGGGFIAEKLHLAHRPRGVSWRQITGIGFIAGIGFTIAMLVTNLSYAEAPELQRAAILGVFLASIISGIIGVILLKSAKRKQYA